MTAQVHSCEKAKGRRSITVESDPNMCAAMMMFGNSFGHDDERQQGCARFVCSLYGNNTNIRTEFGTNCSAARMHTPAICRQFALKYNVARANYQACIWHNSIEAAPHMPSPHGHGWDVIDGHISIHWMDQQPAPKALLQLKICEIDFFTSLTKSCGEITLSGCDNEIDHKCTHVYLYQ